MMNCQSELCCDYSADKKCYTQISNFSDCAEKYYIT